jgi:hypothetical protein
MGWGDLRVRSVVEANEGEGIKGRDERRETEEIGKRRNVVECVWGLNHVSHIYVEVKVVYAI